MKGRKPKSTALKLLQGNPGKRALADGEPTPEAAAPVCPEFLSADARGEWERIAPLLVAQGLLVKDYRAALMGYCRHYARAVEWDKKADEIGHVHITANGTPMVHPYVGLANVAWEACRKFLVEFGLTPAARTRVRVDKKDVPQNPLAELLARRQKKGGA